MVNSLIVQFKFFLIFLKWLLKKDLQTGGGCCKDVGFKVGGVASLSVRFQSSGDWRRAAPQPGVGLLTKLELTL